MALKEIMNVAIFWDITPYSPYANRRFGGTYQLHLRGRKSDKQEISVPSHLLHVDFLLD
jgi:hypothetical protein